MERIPFNDDQSNKGVEGWYGIKGDTFILYVTATNCREDWISNFKAWPERLCPGSEVWVHAGYWPYAHWLRQYFKSHLTSGSIKKVILSGYSMGGGIVQVLKALLFLPGKEVRVVNIDGPRTVAGPPSSFTTQCRTVTYYNRGSLVHAVPPWFRRAPTNVCMNKRWRPVWISHADYDIDEILEEEV